MFPAVGVLLPHTVLHSWSGRESSHEEQGWDVLRCPPWEQRIQGLIPVFCGDFYRTCHSSDWKIGTPVAALPGGWHNRVSDGTGWTSVSVVWLGGIESLICYFYITVAVHAIVWADRSPRYSSMLLGCEATNKQTNCIINHARFQSSK